MLVYLCVYLVVLHLSYKDRRFYSVSVFVFSVFYYYYYYYYLQGRIQACFDSVQPLWVPKKTAQIFLQVAA